MRENAMVSLERAAEFLDRSISSSSPTSTSTPSSSKWPEPLADAAFHGIAGEFVRMVEPVTESDPAAILLQFFVCFGALVGRGDWTWGECLVVALALVVCLVTVLR